MDSKEFENIALINQIADILFGDQIELLEYKPINSKALFDMMWYWNWFHKRVYNSIVNI